MKLGWRGAALILALGLGASTSAEAARSPLEVVQALYAEPNIAFGGPQSSGYLAQDLVSALRTAPTYGPSRRPVDFDYRYGARETEISGFMLIPRDDGDATRVVAVFMNFGRPESVDWTLCRGEDGDWRIADASSSSDSQSWDLRQILRLPQASVRC
jgi:hypothetical protein